MRRVLVAAFGLGFAACGGPAPGAAEVVLGTSALDDGSGFAALTGDQVLVPGAQGGFHIWVKYRVRGMAGGRVDVHRTVRRVSDDRLILQATGTADVAPTAGQWELPYPIPSFMCPTPLGVNVIGEPVVFELTLADEHGTRLGQATGEATPRCPTGSQAAFCQRICSGQ